MAPGIFDISQLTQESGHLFHGGYSFIDNDGCGISGGAGDLNGDGIIDYAVGCRGGSYAAVVYGTQN